jgi:hypothetical protein
LVHNNLYIFQEANWQCNTSTILGQRINLKQRVFAISKIKFDKLKTIETIFKVLMAGSTDTLLDNEIGFKLFQRKLEIFMYK